jgi:hypothetical protein
MFYGAYSNCRSLLSLCTASVVRGAVYGVIVGLSSEPSADPAPGSDLHIFFEVVDEFIGPPIRFKHFDISFDMGFETEAVVKLGLCKYERSRTQRAR